MKITKIAKADLLGSEWDGGKTYEYFIYPPQANYAERNFMFRISSASIDKVPSQFTRFENYKRYLVMLDNSLEIIRNGSKERYEKHELFTFDSNDTITSSSVGNDFNLMVSKNDFSSNVLIGANSLTSISDFVIIYSLVESEIQLFDEKIYLNKNDLLCLENFTNKKLDIYSCKEIIFINIEIKEKAT